jgi:uncharacterized RDD family membrane protein YckC
MDYVAQTRVRYASFGERLLATIVDGFILAIPSMMISVVAQRSESVGLTCLLQLINLGLGLAYSVVFLGAMGRTPGKLFLGLHVTGPDNSLGGLGYGRALLRYIGYIPSTLALFLGYLWMLWDPEKQAWHDKIAETHVVKYI